MAKKNNKKVDKKPIITTKVKSDNSVEVQVTKNPGKTVFGKVVAWIIIVGTIVVPIVGLIFLIASTM